MAPVDSKRPSQMPEGVVNIGNPCQPSLWTYAYSSRVCVAVAWWTANWKFMFVVTLFEDSLCSAMRVTLSCSSVFIDMSRPVVPAEALALESLFLN